MEAGASPSMNIKQIETFVRIVELGSFSAAAEALYASQSTVSARIKDLERYLGAELFDRSFHRAQLTRQPAHWAVRRRSPPSSACPLRRMR